MQFEDWCADYRLFSHHRLPVQDLFAVVRRAVVAQLPPGAPLCVALDDTLLPKTGTRIPGVTYRRDPLGPKFHTNFIRAQRMLQLAAVMPLAEGFRLVPISFLHAPTAPKAPRNASPDLLAQHRRQALSFRLSARAVEQIHQLRHDMDAVVDLVSRLLLIVFDGGYTNGPVLRHLPPRTACVGRIRKDALLYWTPTPGEHNGRGRPRRYGASAPTPEQLRVDESTPWQSMQVSLFGCSHQLRFKCLSGLMWRPAGANLTLQLVVIAPLAYRLRKASRLLYRDPAFLICTDPALDVRQLIQSYICRSDIEVNFREEKSLLGVGQAQVRHPESAAALPAFQVASYAMLLVATARAFSGSSPSNLLPPPKWAPPRPHARLSTQQALHQLRAEVWGRGLGLDNLSGFVASVDTDTKPEKFKFPLASAVLYANA
jgi:hypothetical protein